ncbi:hypothetical protein AB0F81_46870 [Actinoplanes sp. NPDC024001]|uniref:hypothetical protein n=1 Tax=Actinoplanes sp. NPDC024001 TaxID=3154598 RepID=UPI0033CA831B
MLDIEVRSRVTGTGGDLPPVLVRLAEDRTTARELIRRAVEEQIRSTPATTARMFLSDEELRAQAATGAIRVPRPAPAPPDVAGEVERAQQAFARGTFVIFCGGRQVTGLDEEVTVRLGEPVVFLRLVALAGG